MLQAIEMATGKPFTDEQRSTLAKGPDELDLVNSGLEETMINAYQALRETEAAPTRAARPAHGGVPHRDPQGGEGLHGVGDFPLTIGARNPGLGFVRAPGPGLFYPRSATIGSTFEARRAGR